MVFVNLSLDTISHQLSLRDIDHLDKYSKWDFATPIWGRFLVEFPNYPVLKVRLRPGEGYIMPVQNIIHDGYPRSKFHADMTLVLSFETLQYHQPFLTAA